MNNVNALRAISADEITPGNMLSGDSNRPGRFGTGTKITDVEHDRGWIIVRTDSNGTLQFMPWETLYVAVGQSVRPVDVSTVQAGDEVAEHRGGPFRRVMRNGVVSLVLHACPVGQRCTCPARESLTVCSVMKTRQPVYVRTMR